MRWGRSRRYSSANLPALRAGDGGIFPSADGGAVSRAAPCRTFTRRRVRRTVGGRSPRNPTMAACSETGSIACVRRWKPLAGGMGIAGGADMAHFSMPPARRAPRCMLPAACCATAGSGYAPDGAASGQWQCAGRPSAAIRPRRRRAFSAQCPGGPAAAGSAGRVRRGAAQRQREIHVEAGAVVLACGGFPHDRQRLAQVVPHAAEGYGHFSAAPPDNQGEGSGLANPSAASSTLPAPPAGTGAGVPRHSGQRPAANVSSSGGARQTGVIAVLPNGKRFVNEADSYHDFIAALLAATPAGDTPQAAAGRSSYAASLRHGPRQTVPVHPTAAAYRLSAARKHRRSWRSSALSTPMRWRKPLNALTTSPALAKTSIFTAEHQPITAPG